MDIQAYINSGILEEYCLGLLNEREQANLIQMSIRYPQIKDELAAVELALEQLAHSGAIEPGLGVKQRILDMFGINDAYEPISSDPFPVINKSTRYQVWLNALAHLIPGDPSEDISIQVVRNDERLRQMLVISKIDIPEEEHGDYLESFLILQGRCECTVGNSLYTLGAGDFIEIPIHAKHNVKVLTPYVIAVLQYEFV